MFRLEPTAFFKKYQIYIWHRDKNGTSSAVTVKNAYTPYASHPHRVLNTQRTCANWRWLLLVTETCSSSLIHIWVSAILRQINLSIHYVYHYWRTIWKSIHILDVTVALVIQHGKCIRRIILPYVAQCRIYIFPHCLRNYKNFGETVI